MAKLLVNGVGIDYLMQGEGMPFVLLHGWSISKETFQTQIREFARRFRVIALDHRGMGDSDKPPMDIIPLRTMADDLHGLLEKLHVKEKIILLGHSMGGHVAQEFAINYPEKMETLILYGTQATAKHLMIDLDALLKTVEEQEWKVAVQWIAPSFFALGTDPNLIETAIQQLLKTPPSLAAAALKGIIQCDTTARLHTIKAPTLILSGERDVGNPPFKSSFFLHEAIPNSTLRILKKCGHMAHVERPEYFNQALTEFLFGVLKQSQQT